MGFFVYITGEFDCIRCGKRNDAVFQTKLLQSNADTYGRTYTIGDTGIVDGLDGYAPLYPWGGTGELIVIAGDWDCRHCSQSMQWAKIMFDVERDGMYLYGKIVDVSAFIPSPATLHGVHFVEYDLVELSEHWYSNKPVEFRKEALADAYSRWREECIAEKRT